MPRSRGSGGVRPARTVHQAPRHVSVSGMPRPSMTRGAAVRVETGTGRPTPSRCEYRGVRGRPRRLTRRGGRHPPGVGTAVLRRGSASGPTTAGAAGHTQDPAGLPGAAETGDQFGAAVHLAGLNRQGGGGDRRVHRKRRRMCPGHPRLGLRCLPEPLVRCLRQGRRVQRPEHEGLPRRGHGQRARGDVSRPGAPGAAGGSRPRTTGANEATGRRGTAENARREPAGTAPARRREPGAGPPGRHGADSGPHRARCPAARTATRGRPTAPAARCRRSASASSFAEACGRGLPCRTGESVLSVDGEGRPASASRSVRPAVGRRNRVDARPPLPCARVGGPGTCRGEGPARTG